MIRRIVLATKSRTGTAEAAAEALADQLVRKSMWFECTPLPDGAWEFRMKDERRAFFEGLIANLCNQFNLTADILTQEGK